MTDSTPATAADMTDAEAVEWLRDPATSDGLLPQWIRDDIADKLEHAQRGADMLRRLLTNESEGTGIHKESTTGGSP